MFIAKAQKFKTPESSQLNVQIFYCKVLETQEQIKAQSYKKKERLKTLKTEINELETKWAT